jgi:hypothetical protein
LGKNGIWGNALALFDPFFDRNRHAHPLSLDQQQVQRHQRRRDRRQDGDVQSVKPRQRRARHIVATAKHAKEKLAGEGHRAGDASADFGGKERQLVPRQQIPAEAEPEHQEEQQNAAHPGQLARFAIRLQQEHAEEMRERQRDEEIRRPAVDVRTSQPNSTRVTMNWTLSYASAALGR